MGEATAIAWTDSTFSPWWGCTNVSPGCDHCYAEAFAKRTGHDVWGKDGGRRFFGEKHWAEPMRWERAAAASGARHLVFCASMADVFESNAVLEAERARLWELIERTPHLTWQLLTKRPENVQRFVPVRWLHSWPEHVWLGTTVEDQVRAGIRIPRLLAVPGVAVRFLSCEPLLGPVSLTLALDPLDVGGRWSLADIGWVICGGESGPRHRPLDLEDARSLRDECAGAGIPYFFKQVGGRTPKVGGDELDGRRHQEFPATPGAVHA